jgi:hypothetical protein
MYFLVIIKWLLKLVGSYVQRNSWYCFRLGYKVCVCLNDDFHLSKESMRGLLLGVAQLDLASSFVVVQNVYEILE